MTTAQPSASSKLMLQDSSEEGVRGIVGQGGMGVSGLGVFIAAGGGGGGGGQAKGRNGWHTTALAQPPSLQPGSDLWPIFLKTFLTF